MGSGSSFISLRSTINKNDASKKILNNSTKNSNTLLRLMSQGRTNKYEKYENFEPFTLVCLDDEFYDYEQCFQSIIDYICCFDDLKQCEKFIVNSGKYDYFFFIVSNGYAKIVIPNIHDLTQIITIYIIQQNILTTKNNEVIDDDWIKRYSKVKGIYLDRDILLKELSNDVEVYTHICDLLPINIYNRMNILETNDSSNDYIRFLFYQLFIHEYCLKASSLNKSNLIEISEDYYRLNPNELNQINQFKKKYNSTKNALLWFLKNSFVRKLLTKSFLTLNLEVLFTLRFFIKDMHRAMINIGLSSIELPISKEKTYYRSQIISEETFQRIKSNIGELLSINNFFLANKNRHNSLTLMCQNVASTKFFYRVLLEITIPSNYRSQKQYPYIDVTKFSSDHCTILFFIGSIFQINTIIFDLLNDCWIVQLTLYDEELNEKNSSVFAYLHDHYDSPITLADLLRRICPNSAQQFYKHLLKEDLPKSYSKLECYNGLGLCSYLSKDYEQALIYFEKALEFKSNNPFIDSSLHHSIGLVYAQQENIEQAQYHFSKALDNASLPLHIACAHYNLGLIYSKSYLFHEELDHYQKAIQTHTNALLPDCLQMTSLLNNIGVAYTDLREYDKALSNLRKALEMRLKLLPETHIDVGKSYANIGVVYAKTEEFQMALEYFNKAMILFEEQHLRPESDIEQLIDNVKIVNDKMFD